ncbi:MAG TPA: PIN domain-containing protein [Nitrospiria bacterium]|jgi:predicted nucleic acid-binding protein
MLCIDTSSLIAYLEGRTGNDVDLVDRAFSDQVAVLSPVVVTELLSDPHLPIEVRQVILEIPVLPILDGFWVRAGLLRDRMLRSGHKAKLADTLITQNCLDHRSTLVTRDLDFKNFKRVVKLNIVYEPFRKS